MFALVKLMRCSVSRSLLPSGHLESRNRTQVVQYSVLAFLCGQKLPFHRSCCFQFLPTSQLPLMYVMQQYALEGRSLLGQPSFLSIRQVWILKTHLWSDLFDGLFCCWLRQLYRNRFVPLKKNIFSSWNEFEPSLAVCLEASQAALQSVALRL